MKKKEPLSQLVMFIIMLFVVATSVSSYEYEIQPDDVYQPDWSNWWKYPNTYGGGAQLSQEKDIGDIDLDGVNETIQLCVDYDPDCPTQYECGQGTVEDRGSFKITMSNSSDVYFHFYNETNQTTPSCYSTTPATVLQGTNVPLISDDLGIIGYANIDTTYLGSYTVPLDGGPNLTFTEYPILKSLDEKTVSSWTFDDTNFSGSTIYDVKGSNDGNIISATTGQEGILGESFYFNDTDLDYINFGNVFNVLSSNWSANLWVNVPDFNNYAIYISKGDSTYAGGYNIMIATDGTIYFFVNEGGNGEFQRSTCTATADTWEMLTVTYEYNVAVKLYLDGTECAYQGSNFTSWGASSPYNFTIGSKGGITRNAKGNIDEVTMFDEVLTDDEVFILHNNGSARQFPFTENYVPPFIPTGTCNEDMTDFIDGQCVVNGTLILTSNATINGTIVLPQDSVLDGDGYTIYRTDTVGRFILINGSNSTVQDLNYIGSGTNYGGIEIPAGRSGITVRGNSFTSGVDQLFVVNSNVDDLTVEDNVMNATYHVFFLSSDPSVSSGTIIRNNTFIGDTTIGTFLVTLTGQDGMLFENNILDFTTTNAFEYLTLGGNNNSIIKGNTFSTNQNEGILFTDSNPNENLTIRDSFIENLIVDGLGGGGTLEHDVKFINVSGISELEFTTGNYTLDNVEFGVDAELLINDDAIIEADYDDVKEVFFEFLTINTAKLIMNGVDSKTVFDIDDYASTRMNETLDIGQGYVYVDTSTMMDTTATIQFTGVGEEDVPYKDGVICVENCSNVVNAGGVLTFDVTGFSNYSYGEGADTAPLVTSYTPNMTTILSESDLLLNFTTNFTDNESDYMNTNWVVNDVRVQNTTNITTSYDSLLNYSFIGEGDYVVMFNVTQMDNESLYDSVVWNITIAYPVIPVNATQTNVTGAIDINVDEIEESLARIVFLIAGIVTIIMSLMVVGKTEHYAGAGLAILSVVFILMSGIGGAVMVGIIAVLGTILVFMDVYQKQLLGV